MESNSINNESISFIYCLIFLIIPFGILLICWCLYWSHGTTNISKRNNILNKEREIDRQIQKELRKDKPSYLYEYIHHEVLFMGNNINITSKIFDNICIYCGEYKDLQTKESKHIYYNKLLIKYIVKNIQSLIMLTNKNKINFNQLLTISTFGIQKQDKGLNHKQIIEKILNVWNDIDIQNVFSKLKSQTDTKISINMNSTEIEISDEQNNIIQQHKHDTNIFHVEFIDHFLNNMNININQLSEQQLNDNDINILLNEHTFYQNIKGYLGNDEYRLVWERSNFNIRIHESQKNDKWIHVLLDHGHYDIECIVYIIDLSLFKNGNSKYRNVIKYWYTQYMPADIELLILKYITNECFVNDIQRFKRISKHFRVRDRDCVTVLLFVNCDIALEYFKMNGMDKLKTFFPDKHFDYTMSTDDEMKNEILSIQEFYTVDDLGHQVFIQKMDNVSDIDALTKHWNDMCRYVINNSYQQAGLI